MKMQGVRYGSQGILAAWNTRPGDRHPMGSRPGAARTSDSFDAVAGAAEALADTLDMSAHVHDEIAERVPDAAQHAEQERRLAAAERAAAAAYRRGEIPADEVRQVIRDSGRPRFEDDGDVRI